MEQSINLTDVPSSMATNLVVLDSDGSLVTSAGAASLIQENSGLVLVETSRGNLLLSVAGDNMGHTGIAVPTDLQGRQLLTTTIPGLLSVQQDSLVDSQTGDVFTTAVDTDSITGCEESLEDTTGIVGQAPDQILVTADTVLTPTVADTTKQKRKGGWPKGKKRKHVSDVNAPRAPVTGYVLYAVGRRQEIKESNPEIPFAEVTKILGQEWSTMDIEKKQKFLDEAEADKKRYIEEFKIFAQSDAYKSIMKKKRIKAGLCAETDDSTDGYTSLMDMEDELYCRVCDQYFSSIHNKKEHMFGRQHLQNITGELQKEISEQSSRQEQDLSSTSLNVSDINQDSIGSEAGSEVDDSVLDVEGFIHEFLNKNFSRDCEIKQLRGQMKIAQEDHYSLCKQIHELKLYQAKIEEELVNLKTYESSLASQIDGLKMVSTLFGVINFQV